MSALRVSAFGFVAPIWLLLLLLLSFFHAVPRPGPLCFLVPIMRSLFPPVFRFGILYSYS